MERTDKIITIMLLAVLFQEFWRHSVWGIVGITAAMACWKLVGWAAIKEVARDDADQVS